MTQSSPRQETRDAGQVLDLRSSDPAVQRFIGALRPLLDEHCARSAWLVGSHARGDAAPESDIDAIIVAPSDRAFVDRFRDYLPAVLAAGVGVDLFVYTPEEFEGLLREERPFLTHAMESARPVHVG